MRSKAWRNECGLHAHGHAAGRYHVKLMLALYCAKQGLRAWQLGEGSRGAALLAGGGVIDHDDPDVVLGPRDKAIGFDGLLCTSRGEAGGGGQAAPGVLHLDLQRIRWQLSARLLRRATL